LKAEIEAGDAFAFNPALGNVNNAVLSNSKYGDTLDCFIGVASKKWKYGTNDKWATSFYILNMHKEDVLVYGGGCK
jgi:hypothetical protein